MGIFFINPQELAVIAYDPEFGCGDPVLTAVNL